jgi:uncharacterized protein (TIGR03435 family)
MAPLFLEVAVRAALIAAGTAVVLWALRIKTPAVRHAAWTAVVLAMLVLPLWSVAGLKLAVPVLPATIETTATAPSVVMTSPRVVDAPIVTTAPPSPVAIESSRQVDWQLVLIAIYSAGVVVLLVRLGIGTLQAQRLRRTAVARAGRATSDRCATPITVGFWSPALILPSSWPQWPAAQLQAVLTHENEHARRRDPLVQWLALLNRAVFWFHPLAWWLERRLATLAEEACDAAVLAAGNSPQDYSEYLLEMARQVSHQGRRVRTIGMAMPGSGLKPRLKQILEGLPVAPTSRARMICTISFCAISSVLFTAGTLARQTPASSMQIKFDVVSIKPCEGSGDPGARGGGAGTARSMISPGYSFQACQTLNQLIDMAWGGGSFPTNWLLNTIRVPPGSRPDIAKRVRGGPAWAEEERFSVEIRMSGDTTDLTGSARHNVVANEMAPAMRAMLADRFQLKLRKVTEQVPMYAMTVAAGGLKIPQTAKPGEKCWEPLPATSRAAEPIAPPGSEGLPPCRYGFKKRSNAGNSVWELSYISLGDFAKELSKTVDRYVLDQTGLDGRYSLTLEYASDERTPGDTFDPFRRLLSERGLPEPPAGTGPSIFKAVEVLGLKLEPTKGPAEYLQIDSVQRPRPDAPVEISEPPARASGPFVAAESDQAQVAAQKFAVASVKPCEGGAANGPVPSGGIGASGGGGGVSLNTITVRCQTVMEIIARAYMMFGNPPPLNALNRFAPEKITGGPAWARSERYEIEAKADGTPGPAVMMGPMLRALLEERFQLKLHEELKEVPAFALTVAATGLKVKPVDPAICTAGSASAADRPRCTSSLVFNGPGQPNLTFKATGQSFDLVAQSLGPMFFDRVVVDKTAAAGLFSFSVEFTPDENTPARSPISAGPPAGTSIFTAFEKQIGLKFVPTKAQQGHLVVDRLARPSPDTPAPATVLK